MASQQEVRKERERKDEDTRAPLDSHPAVWNKLDALFNGGSTRFHVSAHVETPCSRVAWSLVCNTAHSREARQERIQAIDLGVGGLD